MKSSWNSVEDKQTKPTNTKSEFSDSIRDTLMASKCSHLLTNSRMVEVTYKWDAVTSFPNFLILIKVMTNSMYYLSHMFTSLNPNTNQLSNS